MNAGPDVERLISGWLADQAPGRAPDRLVDAAVRVIERTNQRRFVAAWREPMYVTMRGLMAAALVGVVAIGGAILFLDGKPSADAGASPTPGAVASTEPSAAAVRPIANGTYQASIAVADVNARLQADTSLTADDRATIVHSILLIDKATTLNVEVAVDDDKFTGAYGTDGGFTVAGSPWRLYVLDATTIALGDPTGTFGIQAWGVTRRGSTFTLRAMSPATEPIETFVRSVLYEMAPFVPKS